jgi:hypothetical protein
MMADSLAGLLRVMAGHGAVRFYAKKLAPNDNSKNQIYLGGNYSALNILPFGRVETDSGDRAGSKRDRAKAALSFFWVAGEHLHPAPGAGLILYPKYPEVRMSGFLKGCSAAPSEIMASRDEGRTLFLGITPDGRILGYAAGPGSPLRRELDTLPEPQEGSVFIPLTADAGAAGDTRGQLLQALREIHQKAWIASKRMTAGGPVPYEAANGGGYTLEAELGISPNGYAEPDYLGWEVKQYAVKDFIRHQAANPVTLLTPEPTGGIYREQGVEAFIRQFGYADRRGRADRLNFGGIYKVGGGLNAGTGVRLVMTGFDAVSGKITDMSQGIALVDAGGTIAALWHYGGILEHWSRKHARTVYVPSLRRKNPAEYAFGRLVQLCIGTGFELFLTAMAAGLIYYDPGIKLEGAATGNPSTKRRSQFRIRHGDMAGLYHAVETVDLLTESAGDG